MSSVHEPTPAGTSRVGSADGLLIPAALGRGRGPALHAENAECRGECFCIEYRPVGPHRPSRGIDGLRTKARGLDEASRRGDGHHDVVQIRLVIDTGDPLRVGWAGVRERQKDKQDGNETEGTRAAPPMKVTREDTS